MSTVSSSTVDRLIIDGAARDCAREASVPIDATNGLAAGLEQAMRSYADRPAFGWRPAAGSGFEWVSYRRFFQDSTALGAALRAALQESGASVSEATLVGLSGRNSYDWMVADFGCLWAALGTVPLSEAWEQATLGGVCAHAQLSAIVTTPDLAHQMLHGAKEAGAALLCVMGGEVPEGLAAAAAGLRVSSVAALLAAAPPTAEPLPVTYRSSSAIHTILHTSGTTGLPKGEAMGLELPRSLAAISPA